jgi:hypothetical protein
MAAVECMTIARKLKQNISLLEWRKLELGAKVDRFEGVSMTLRKDSATSDEHLRKMGEEMGTPCTKPAVEGRGSAGYCTMMKPVGRGAPVLRSKNKRLEQELLRMQRQVADVIMITTDNISKFRQSLEKLKRTNLGLQAKNRNLQQRCG